jgi:hypothetical protein
MNRRAAGGAAAAAAIALAALAGCGGAAAASGPPAQDVRACSIAATALTAHSADAALYFDASYVAVTPALRAALAALASDVAGPSQAGTPFRAASAICAKDGVRWPAAQGIMQGP